MMSLCFLSFLSVGLSAAQLLLPDPAFAAGAAAGASHAPSTPIFLAQVAVLILVGRILGEVMQRLGQPSVIGQLICGVLLGPSVLGALWPSAQHMLFPADEAQKSMLDAVSQLGILLLLLLTGMEANLSLLRRVGHLSIIISLFGISIPFACGMMLGLHMPDRLLPQGDDRLVTSLFLGTALAISSVKIVAAVLDEINFLRRKIGQLILSSAIIDDSIGWIIIAVTLSLAESRTIDILSVARGVLGTAVFLGFSLTIGRRLVFNAIRWANDTMVSEFPVISLVLLIMAAMALITQAIGVHTMLGAFVAGVLVGESPILTRQIAGQLRALIMGLFAPVFFGLAGLTVDLGALKNPTLAVFTVALIGIATFGKLTGAFVGGKIGRLGTGESLALAAGMNARGSTEIIIASIGLSMGVLTQDVFTGILVMAVVSTMAMPPTLRWLLQRLPPDREESERLEREDFDARGFVPNLERILVAVDGSASGRFAARLAGLIAGWRNMPTTVLHVGPEAADQTKRKDNVESPESHLAAGMQAVRDSKQDEAEEENAPTTIISKMPEADVDAAVVEEAKKGFDLMVVGIEADAVRRNGFPDDLARMTAGFEGPLAIVIAHGEHLANPADSRLNILTPVTGTETSRRGAEIAAALARAGSGSVTAIYVSSDSSTRRRRGAERQPSGEDHEQAILKDFGELSHRYGVAAHTVVRVNEPPDKAILAQAREGGIDTIIMGVNRRPGTALFFGDVAASVIENAAASIVLVTSSANPGAANNAEKDGNTE